jgi:low temperature requirement protein LtrA
MPQLDPSLAYTKDTSIYVKKVSWLELFFDLVFALALTMSAKSLENVNDFSKESWMALGEFLLIFIFLIMFWYRHMLLMNRFDHSSFVVTIMTLFIGFIVVAFTQFIRIWRIPDIGIENIGKNADLGSFLATIAMFLGVLVLAALYFFFSARMIPGGANEKVWARTSAKHMALESLGYLLALLVTPAIRPFWFIAVFIYFNRYPFETFINPKKQSTLHPALINLLPENVKHKMERIGLFSLLVYGLILILAAAPLLEIDDTLSVAKVINPMIIFGQIFLYVSVIWFIHYRMFEVAEAKGNQFATMTFIILTLLVANTFFMKILLKEPSQAISIFFAVSSGLMMAILATLFWNVKGMQSVSLGENMIFVFKQWAFLLYIAAGAFIVSSFFDMNIMQLIWKIIIITLFICALFELRLSVEYYMGTRFKPHFKFFDSLNMTGISFIVLGGIIFFVMTTLLRKDLASWWMLTWVAPTLFGIFVIINNMLFNRIKPN